MSDPKTSPPVRRWVRVLLVVSLGVNLLVAGAVVGAFLNGPPDRRSGASNAEMTLPYTRALTEDDRRDVRRELRRTLFSDRDEHGALAQSYVRAIEVLRAAPFDPEALTTVLEDQSNTARSRMVKGQQALIAVITGMTDADRAAYADRLEHELQKLEKRGKAWNRGSRDKPDR